MVWDIGFSAVPWYGMEYNFQVPPLRGMVWDFDGISHGMINQIVHPPGWDIRGISHQHNV